MAAPVTGRAKLKNQPPPVVRSIYSRYTPMAEKFTGTKITGLGRLNHRGSTASTYSSASPPSTKPDQTMPPLTRQSTSTLMTAGSSIHTVTTNSAPTRLTSSLGCSAGG